MSTYTTVVYWSRIVTESEMIDMTNYIGSQSEGNGVETTYAGNFARSWVDESAANAFCEFAKTLLVDPPAPTRTQIIRID